MNEVEPLSTAAAEFLKAHAATGTPTADELRRVRARVVARDENVIPLRRGWRWPELWAVAAVLALVVSGQLVSVAVRGAGGETPRAAGEPTPQAPSVTLAVGATTTRPMPGGLQRIAIGDPDIVDLTPREGAVELIGKRAGQTTVLLWFADGSRQTLAVTVE